MLPAAHDAPHGAIPLPDALKASALNIPVLPHLAARLISLASDPETTIYQLAQIVSKDQVLATRLLSFANSAFVASAGEISTITDAVMRVGTSGVRNVALTACFASRLHDPKVYGAEGQRLAEHGVGTAYMARLVADGCGVDEDSAFLCGLLHDIGKLVILKSFYDSARRQGVPADPLVVADTVQRWHPTVAGLTFRHWSLPEELDEPVMCHHGFSVSHSNRRLAAAIQLANVLSHRYGFGCDASPDDDAAAPCLVELGLDERWLAQTDSRAPGLFAIARESIC